MAFAETSSFMIIGQDGHKYNDLFNLSGKTQAAGIPAIMNSDQGSQFTSGEYKQIMKDLGIRQSMDGKSRWADNIMIERWFRSLKTELIYCNEFGSPRESFGRRSVITLKATIPFVPTKHWAMKRRRACTNVSSQQLETGY